MPLRTSLWMARYASCGDQVVTSLTCLASQADWKEQAAVMDAAVDNATSVIAHTTCMFD